MKKVLVLLALLASLSAPATASAADYGQWQHGSGTDVRAVRCNWNSTVLNPGPSNYILHLCGTQNSTGTAYVYAGVFREGAADLLDCGNSVPGVDPRKMFAAWKNPSGSAQCESLGTATSGPFTIGKCSSGTLNWCVTHNDVTEKTIIGFGQDHLNNPFYGTTQKLSVTYDNSSDMYGELAWGSPLNADWQKSSGALGSGGSWNNLNDGNACRYNPNHNFLMTYTGNAVRVSETGVSGNVSDC